MDLKLSKRGDYVVRSAICLARTYGSAVPTKLRQVSADMGVPRTFVSQILGDLVHAGLAVSSFGTRGGYRLARPPHEISLLEVIEAGEGRLVPDRCVLGDGPCRSQALCPVHHSWAALAGALETSFGATSLAELAEADERAEADGVIEAGTDLVPADAPHPTPPEVAVADSIHVELAISTVATRLRGGASWLASHLQAATALGEATRLRVGPGGPAWLGKTVAVHVGEPRSTGDTLTLPLSWEATGPKGLFPRFDGDLHLSSLDPDRTEVRLSGRYRPPFGIAGQILDEALLTHVARATIRALLRRVAQVLEDAPPEQPDGAAEISGRPTPQRTALQAHAGRQ